MKEVIPGHIRIKNQEVHFEPDGLPEPNYDDYEYGHHSTLYHKQTKSEYLKDFAEYEASKQLVEVSNGYSISNTLKHIHISFKNKSGELIDLITNIPDNQPCKAEVTGETCTIAELN